MYVDNGISFSNDIEEVSREDGSLVTGITKYTYTTFHIPSGYRDKRDIYVVGGLEEIGNLINEWNKVNPEVWQYELCNL